MIEFIRLTEADADSVRGQYLDPRMVDLWPFNEPNYILPLEVLTDPLHEDKWVFLSSLPRVSIDPAALQWEDI